MQWRDDTEMRIFRNPTGASFAYSSNYSTENYTNHWTRSCVHWRNHFQVPRSCGMWNQFAVRCPPSFSVWNSWILYGRNRTNFVSICNGVLDMLNCRNACRMDVFGWFSNNAWTRSLSASVTNVDFRPDVLFLVSQTILVVSNLFINL